MAQDNTSAASGSGRWISIMLAALAGCLCGAGEVALRTAHQTEVADAGLVGAGEPVRAMRDPAREDACPAAVGEILSVMVAHDADSRIAVAVVPVVARFACGSRRTMTSHAA